MKIETENLLLRTWKAEDLDPFFAINQDLRVMALFPRVLSRKETNQFIKRITAHFETYGYGLFAVEYSETGLFIGYVGLMRVDFEARFTPAVEIGWRLASAFWGNGYATEAAKAALDHGFNRLQLQEVVSFTTKSNMRSQRVMEKIGPKHTSEDDFDHPKLDADSPLSRHVLYRLTKNQYDLFR